MEKSDNTERSTLIVVWATILLVSGLPQIILWEVFQVRAGWLQWVLIAALLLLAVAPALWPGHGKLRKFFPILAAIPVSHLLVDLLTATRAWSRLFTSPSFSVEMLDIQLARLLVTGLMIAALTGLGYRPREYYLALGDLKAPIKPVRLLGYTKPEPWSRFGLHWGIYISLGTFLFVYLAGRPGWAAFAGIAGILPMILLLAAMNAFSEEVAFRGSLLAGLGGAIDLRQAVWAAAAYFGIAHFYGVPYGVLGVLMSTFLGWMLGKAMIETRGLFWAWFIHFLQDVVIFSFLAIGAVNPGG